jgi:hypothetical protein
MSGEKRSQFVKIQVFLISVVACISQIQQLIQADYNPACCPVLPPNAQLISVWKEEKEKIKR